MSVDARILAETIASRIEERVGKKIREIEHRLKTVEAQLEHTNVIAIESVVRSAMRAKVEDIAKAMAAHILAKMEDSIAALDEASKKIREVLENLSESTDRIVGIKDELARLSDRMDMLSKRLDELSNNLRELSKSVVRLTTEVQTLQRLVNENHRATMGMLSELKSSMKELHESITTATEEIGKML